MWLRNAALASALASALGCGGYGVLYRVAEVPPPAAWIPDPEPHLKLAGEFAAEHGLVPIPGRRDAGLGKGRAVLAQFRRPGPERLYLSVVSNADGTVDFYLLDLAHSGETRELAALADALAQRLNDTFPDARVERVHAGRPGAPLAAP